MPVVIVCVCFILKKKRDQQAQQHGTGDMQVVTMTKKISGNLIMVKGMTKQAMANRHIISNLMGSSLQDITSQITTTPDMEEAMEGYQATMLLQGMDMKTAGTMERITKVLSLDPTIDQPHS